MRVYNKNFRPEFKILINYINIKGLQNSTEDDVFLGEQQVKYYNDFKNRDFKVDRVLGHMFSMFNKHINVELYFDEFLNFYCLDEDEDRELESGYYILKSIDSLDYNENLEKILKILVELIEQDSNY